MTDLETNNVLSIQHGKRNIYVQCERLMAHWIR